MTNTDFDPELLERIEALTELGHLDRSSKEYGVAQQVISQGESTLSPKQRVVWEKGVMPLLAIPLTDDEAFVQALRKDQEEESRSRP